MPRNLFNGTCRGCGRFKPRCARVHVRVGGGWRKEPEVYCQDCRKVLKGEYHLADEHKGKRQ